MPSPERFINVLRDHLSHSLVVRVCENSKRSGGIARVEKFSVGQGPIVYGLMKKMDKLIESGEQTAGLEVRQPPVRSSGIVSSPNSTRSLTVLCAH